MSIQNEDYEAWLIFVFVFWSLHEDKGHEKSGYWLAFWAKKKNGRIEEKYDR